MTGKTARTGQGKAGRQDRLKAALKANLQRRKAQARARKPGPSQPVVTEPGKTEEAD